MRPSAEEVQRLAEEAVGKLAAAAAMLANCPEYGRVECGQRLWDLAVEAEELVR
jgi:hypothetical protein